MWGHKRGIGSALYDCDFRIFEKLLEFKSYFNDLKDCFCIFETFGQQNFYGRLKQNRRLRSEPEESSMCTLLDVSILITPRKNAHRNGSALYDCDFRIFEKLLEIKSYFNDLKDCFCIFETFGQQIFYGRLKQNRRLRSEPEESSMCTLLDVSILITPRKNAHRNGSALYDCDFRIFEK